MQPGDKFRTTDPGYDWEVVEDTGKNIIGIHTVNKETATFYYYQVITDLPRCARCGRPRHQSELKSGVIIFQNSRLEYDRRKGSMVRKKFVDRKTQLFCHDTPCHSHEQMAHEG